LIGNPVKPGSRQHRHVQVCREHGRTMATFRDVRMMMSLPLLLRLRVCLKLLVNELPLNLTINHHGV